MDSPEQPSKLDHELLGVELMTAWADGGNALVLQAISDRLHAAPNREQELAKMLTGIINVAGHLLLQREIAAAGNPSPQATLQ
jgi:hypothetical protein